MGGVVAPFVVGAKVGDRRLDLDDQQRAVAVDADDVGAPPVGERQLGDGGEAARPEQPPTPRADRQRRLGLAAVDRRFERRPAHVSAPSASARIIAAAFSAIIIVGEAVLPEVMRGITEASAIAQSADAAHAAAARRPPPSDRRRGPSSPCRPDGRSSCRCRRPPRRARRRSRAAAPGQIFLGPEARERRRRGDAAREPDRIDGDAPVLVGREIVRPDRRRGARIGARPRGIEPRLVGLQVADAERDGGKGVQRLAEPVERQRLDVELDDWRWRSRARILANMPSCEGAMVIGPRRLSA